MFVNEFRTVVFALRSTLAWAQNHTNEFIQLSNA